MIEPARFECSGCGSRSRNKRSDLDRPLESKTSKRRVWQWVLFSIWALTTFLILAIGTARFFIDGSDPAVGWIALGGMQTLLWALAIQEQS